MPEKQPYRIWVKIMWYMVCDIAVLMAEAGVQGWGLLSQFPPFRYFRNFSALSKHTLDIEHHVYIWQVSPQLSCCDTCQVWMWIKESNSYFCEIENFAYGETNERSFSNPHPRISNYIPRHTVWCNYLSMPSIPASGAEVLQYRWLVKESRNSSANALELCLSCTDPSNDLAPVPLMVFWSKSKFNQNSQCLGLKCAQPITTKFCTHHYSVTVVTCAKICCDRLNMLWTGAF